MSHVLRQLLYAPYKLPFPLSLIASHPRRSTPSQWHHTLRPQRRQPICCKQRKTLVKSRFQHATQVRSGSLPTAPSPASTNTQPPKQWHSMLNNCRDPSKWSPLTTVANIPLGCDPLLSSIHIQDAYKSTCNAQIKSHEDRLSSPQT